MFITRVDVQPLAFIVLVSGVRAALEDYRRHQADKHEAMAPYLVLDRVSLLLFAVCTLPF